MQRLAVLTASRDGRVALGWLDLSTPAAAASEPREASDSTILDFPLLLGSSSAGLAQALHGRQPCDPKGARGRFRLPGRVVTNGPFWDCKARPKGESPPLAAVLIKRSTSATPWPNAGAKRTSRKGGRDQVPRLCLLSGRGCRAVHKSHRPGQGHHFLRREQHPPGPRVSRHRP